MFLRLEQKPAIASEDGHADLPEFSLADRGERDRGELAEYAVGRSVFAGEALEGALHMEGSRASASITLRAISADRFWLFVAI